MLDNSGLDERINFSFIEGFYYGDKIVEHRFLEFLKEKMMIACNIFSVLILIYNLSNSIDSLIASNSDCVLDLFNNCNPSNLIDAGLSFAILILCLILCYLMNNRRLNTRLRMILCNATMIMMLLDYLRGAISIYLIESRCDTVIRFQESSDLKNISFTENDTFLNLLMNSSTQNSTHTANRSQELTNFVFFNRDKSEFIEPSSKSKLSQLLYFNSEHLWIESSSFLMLSYKNNLVGLLLGFMMRTAIFNVFATDLNASKRELIKQNIFSGIIYVLVGLIKHYILRGFTQNFMYIEKFKEIRHYYEGFINDFNSPILTLTQNKLKYKPNQRFKQFSSAFNNEGNDETLKLQESNYKDFLGKFLKNCSEQPCSLNLIIDNIYSQHFNQSISYNNSERTFSPSNQGFICYGIFEYSGQRMHYYEISIRLFLINNKPYCVDLVFHDISQIKLLESKKTEIQLRSNMFSKIAHEFKTPLIAITSELAYLEDRTSKLSQNLEILSCNLEAAELNEIIKISGGIKNLAKYTNFLIQDIIYYSENLTNIKVVNAEIEDIQTEVIEFNFNVLTALLNYWTGDKSRIRPDLKVDCLVRNYKLMTDVTRLNQIILNIISNAVKFTKKGSILLEFFMSTRNDFVKSQGENLLLVEATNEDDVMIVKIQDNGPGICKSILSESVSSNHLSLASKDYNNSMGTGLGLGIIKSISKILNYDVYVSSSCHGTCYYLAVPAYTNLKIESSKSANLGLTKCLDSVYMSDSSQKVEVQLDYPVSSHKKSSSFVLEIPKERETGSMSSSKTVFKSNSFNQNISCRPSMSFQSTQLMIKSKKWNSSSKYFDDTNSLNSQSSEHIESKGIIIICDDSKLILDGTEKLLRSIHELKSKYKIVRATDGSSLIEKIIKYSSSSTIKLVITDENMEYVNGSQAVSLIKSLEKNGKLIYTTDFVCVTAFEDEESKKKLINSGFKSIIAKPLNKSRLFTVLNEFRLLD